MDTPSKDDIAPDQVVQQTWEEATQSASSGEVRSYGAGMSPIAGSLKSPGFKSGEAGWKIDSAGNAEFNNGVFRGDLVIGGLSKTIDNTSDIQTALDALNTDGGGTLYLKPGTYTLTASGLTMYSGVNVVGAAYSNTILDFNSTAGEINCAGASVYNTGTITSIASGVNVTGSGTSWLANVTAGTSQLFMGNRWHLVAAVTGDTTLVLAEAYSGPTVGAGTAYRIASPKKDILIKNLTIKNSTGTGLDVDDSRAIYLENLVFLDNNVGFNFTNCSELKFDQINSVSNTSDGYQLTNVGFCDFEAINGVGNGGNGATFNNVRTIPVQYASCSGNTGDGYNITSATDVVLKVEASSNGGQGIELVSGNDNVEMSSCLISNNTSDGIKLTATSDNCRIVSSKIDNNGGYGINIAASTCDNTYVVAPSHGTGSDANTSGNLSDSGTGTVIIQETDSAVLTKSFTAATAITATDAVSIIPSGLALTDAVAKATRTSTTSTLTPANDQVWMVMGFRGPGTHTAGAGTTKRVQSGGNSIFDSNGAVNAGVSKTLTVTTSSGDTSALSTTIVPVSGQTIAADATSSPDAVDPGTSLTGAHTITGSTTALFVMVVASGGAGNVTGVTYNSDAMTQLGSEFLIDAGTSYASIWYRINADTGTNNYVVTATSSARIEAIGASYTNVAGIAAASDNVGEVVKATAANATIANAFVGFANSTVAADASVDVTVFGVKSSLSGLSVGNTYYLSDTAGAIATSAGSTSKTVGMALSATTLLIKNS